jgi:effector-binding domain-containing protein
VTESIQYEVIKRLDDVEIRQYPTIVQAMVEGKSDDEAFGILFRYITGENRSSKKMAMTAPVISWEPSSQEIAMTRPVVSDEKSFSFVLPNLYSIGTAPQPKDERIKLLEVKARRLAVLSFSGRDHDHSVQKYEEALLEKLKNAGITVKGPILLMRYNSPFTPGFLRHNEVAFEID